MCDQCGECHRPNDSLGYIFVVAKYPFGSARVFAEVP